MMTMSALFGSADYIVCLLHIFAGIVKKVFWSVLTMVTFGALLYNITNITLSFFRYVVMVMPVFAKLLYIRYVRVLHLGSENRRTNVYFDRANTGLLANITASFQMCRPN